ncbi:TolC family protein, partial [Myxococcota bacterium]|nr:TolC family protein [Myxococcota bacterium]
MALLRVITCTAILALGTGAPAHAQTSATRRTLTLDEALATAKQAQPRLTQARASTDAARARVEQAGSGLWPQVSASVGYQHTEGADRTIVGTGTAGTTGTVVSGSRNFYSASLSASQLVWDFGQTLGQKRAAAASAEATKESARTTEQDVALDVRLAFFTARAQRALVDVARETLTNQQRHLAQIQAFVTVGTRPEIDLAQARTDLANARVQLINAENAYETAKAQLNVAMGVEASTDFDVAPEPSRAPDGEELTLDALLDEAMRARPELAALAEQLRAEELSMGATRGEYWPSINASTSLGESGESLGALDWSWTLQV